MSTTSVTIKGKHVIHFGSLVDKWWYIIKLACGTLPSQGFYVRGFKHLFVNTIPNVDQSFENLHNNN